MASSSHISDAERIMHKLKKRQEEDLFVYEGGQVNCKCGLRATKSITYNLERYFGNPLEKDGNSCGFYERLEVREVVDAVRREKEEIIENMNTDIRYLVSWVKALKSRNHELSGCIDALSRREDLSSMRVPSSCFVVVVAFVLLSIFLCY